MLCYCVSCVLGPQTVQKRGATVIEKRGLSSAMSAAKAIVDHMRNWWFGTKDVSTWCARLHTGEMGSTMCQLHVLPPSVPPGRMGVNGRFV